MMGWGGLSPNAEVTLNYDNSKVQILVVREMYESLVCVAFLILKLWGFETRECHIGAGPLA